jgi:hypothetical protein
MNNIELYVDDILIDFKTTDGLPFSIADIIDDLNEVGVMKSNKLLNFSDTIILPATKINKIVLSEKGVKSLKVIKNSQQLFSSKIKVTGTNYENSRIVSFSCQVFGGNGDLVSILNDVSLRDLDLGFEAWTNTNILASRTGDCDTFKGMFTPVLYGKLDSGTNNIAEIDLRLHVYFDVIMRGIASFLNVTLVSNFFDTSELWRRAVNVYGVGSAFQVDVGTLYNYSGEISGTTSNTLNVSVANGGYFVVTVDVPTGGGTTLTQIRLTSSNGYARDVFFRSNTGLEYITPAIEILDGGFFKVEGQDGGGSAVNLPDGTSAILTMQPLVAVGGSIAVQSCLHDESIVTWLKSQFQKFNLVSFYDSILKKWYIEPRFNYDTGDGLQSGFYSKLSAGNFTDIDIDNTAFSNDAQYKYGKIRFKYKNDEVFQNALEGRNLKSIPTNSTETTLNNQDELLLIEDVFYHNATNVVSTICSAGLLSALDSSFNFGDLLSLATFESNPVCALVSNDSIFVEYKGANTAFPKLVQNVDSITATIRTFGYCDILNIRGSGTTAKGFVSTFYQNWLSSLKRFKVLKGNCNVKVINEKSNFVKVYKNESQAYLINSIDDFSVEEKTLTPCTFFAISNVYLEDLDDTEHNGLTTLFTVLLS